MDPVCYVANVNGTIVLGYEEGNGNSLLPCPGGRRAYPFTESEIMNADEAQLEDMCSMCYQSVCPSVLCLHQNKDEIIGIHEIILSKK